MYTCTPITICTCTPYTVYMHPLYVHIYRIPPIISTPPMYTYPLFLLLQYVHVFTALVNKGNCLFSMHKYNEAKGHYQEALSVEATCSEALFNLGLTFKRLGDLPSALECFNKLQAIFKNLPQVLYNIADMYPIPNTCV